MADEAPAAAAPVAPPATPAAPPDGSSPQPAATEAPKAPVTREAAIAQIETTEDYGALEAELDKANAAKSEEASSVATAPATAPTPAPAAAATTDGAPAPSAEPTPAPAAPGSDDNETIEDAAGEKLPKNFRFHTTDPKRSRFLQLLRREEGINPIEAARRVGYELPASEAVAPATAPQPTSAESIESALKPMRDEIAALQAQKTAAREAFEFDEVDKIADQILEKRLALDRKQSELEAEASYNAEYSAVYDGAKAEAVAKYPDTAKRGTPQFEEVARERAYLESTEPGFFDDPNYPVELIKRLETRRPDLFKSATPAAQPPVPAPPPAAVTPPPNAAARQPARPVGQVAAGTESSTQPLTREATVAAIDAIDDPEELARLADAVGTPAGPKGARVRR